jgi:hypothetical protein
MRTIKLYILVAAALLTGGRSFGQEQAKYWIYENDIHVCFCRDGRENATLVERVLEDTLARACTSMFLCGDFVKVPCNFHKLNREITYMEINVMRPFVIDKQFSSLTRLECLYVFSRIKRVDEDVRLPALQGIWFRKVGLKGFPKAICHWEALEDVEITGCDFPVIPGEIGNLRNLLTLNLNSNKIIVLPDEIYSLKNMKGLVLNDNKLRRLSPLACKLENLKAIYLDDNPRLVIDAATRECLSGKIWSLWHDFGDWGDNPADRP